MVMELLMGPTLKKAVAIKMKTRRQGANDDNEVGQRTGGSQVGVVCRLPQKTK